MHLSTTPDIESDSILPEYFLPYQIQWIIAERAIHAQSKQAIALVEKSVRIGWTYADAFKNVRKRLLFPKRDYLFATKDLPSALEYVQQCYKFAEIFNLTKYITFHDEDDMEVNRLDERGKPSALTEKVKVGMIKFDNGSRIIAFSASPQSMAVHGGDVGLDEFAKHPNAKLLWETAQGRITWGGDLAVWSSHDGEDTLFNEFAIEARAACASGLLVPSSSGHWHLHSCSDQPSSEPKSSSPSPSDSPGLAPEHREGDSLSALGRGLGEVVSKIENPEYGVPASAGQESLIQNRKSKIENRVGSSSDSTIQRFNDSTPAVCPWNLYFRVTMPDAIQLGLVDVINRARGTKLTRVQFLADCKTRARQEEIFEQAYMCNPAGASTNHIVDWSAIERCRYDYDFSRVHLEDADIVQRFGNFDPSSADNRQHDITDFITSTFRPLFSDAPVGGSTRLYSGTPLKSRKYRLGFDVAASGQGDLAVIYIDEAKGDELWLRGLFTCRTEDWHFLKTVLFHFLRNLRSVRAAGDESGLGKQICWEAASQFGSLFSKVNFSGKKHDLGFALMNQLCTAQKRFPKSQQDIAADFFALRKEYSGTRWAFSEGRNALNPASHCDIAWAGALASHAHLNNQCTIGGAVLMDDGTVWRSDRDYKSAEHNLLWSDDPRIWRPL